jgi:TolA-binding protein
MKNYLFLLILVVFFGSCNERQKMLDHIQQNEKQLFADTMIHLTEDKLVIQTIADYESFVKKYPNDSLAPSLLFKAADLAIARKSYKQAIDFFGTIIQRYPDSKKAPFALFMQAFTYENNLVDLKTSQDLYKEFLGKFPNHELAMSAQFSLNNLGISDNELGKILEAKADSLKKIHQ